MKRSRDERSSKSASSELMFLAEENRDYNRGEKKGGERKATRPNNDPAVGKRRVSSEKEYQRNMREKERAHKARAKEMECSGRSASDPARPSGAHTNGMRPNGTRPNGTRPNVSRTTVPKTNTHAANSMGAERQETRTAGEGGKRKNRNRTFAGVTYLFVTLFICMMGYIVYFNAVRAGDIVNSPYNPRTNLMAEQYIRGKILASDGTVLAETVQSEDGSTYRRYPYGNTFSHVVGYDSNGKAGIESTSNFSLLNSHAFFLEKIANEFKGEKTIGDNVVTTLRTDLQEAAYNAMGDNRGAVVAIEPSTGRVLAMVSKPDYDPNSIAEMWDAYNSDNATSVLLNRATQGSYPPGSTFKILTALEYIREYSDYGEYSYTCSGSITQGDTTIQCYNGTVHGEESLLTSFANSCNASFSNIGMMLDGSDYRKTCEELLFNSKLPGPFATVKTQFKVDDSSGYATKMMTAMGQGETLTNPYHMALITAAIANGGTLMEPYVVEQVQNYSGTVVSKNSPHTYKKMMTAEEAQILTELMTAVVTQGTAQELSYASYTVAGKTGTAEYSDDKSLSHSWFVGFSNVENPDLVVAVIMEGYDGNSSARSLPVAKAVFDAYHQ